MTKVENAVDLVKAALILVLGRYILVNVIAALS